MRDGISVTTRPNLDVSNSDVEILSLTCKQGMHRNTNLTAVYRPPMGNVQTAIDSIESVVENIRLSTSGDTIILGDLNVDLLTNNSHTRKLKNFANSCRLEQLITEITVTQVCYSH